MANSGVFSINDINFLRDWQQWETGHGSLKLLGKIEANDIVTADFGNEILNVDYYDTHFFTYTNVRGNSQTAQDLGMRVSVDGKSYISSNVYKYANVDRRGSVSASDIYSNGNNRMMLGPDLDNETNSSTSGSGWIHLAGNINTYTFLTDSNIVEQSSVGMRSRFGSSLYPSQARVEAIRFCGSSGHGFETGTFTMYGLEYN